jgi:tetratricopeptide (TPR) repeat protein
MVMPENCHRENPRSAAGDASHKTFLVCDAHRQRTMKPKSKKSTKLSPAAQKAKRAAGASEDTAKTISSLIARSRTALEDGDLDGAHSLAARACQLLPAESPNVQCIELLGELNIEAERFDEARECFLEAVRRRQDVPPNPGEEGKFLWLGQLSEGEESQTWYLKGIEILKRIVEIAEDENAQKKARNKLCESYCSVVELYLTDLW